MISPETTEAAPIVELWVKGVVQFSSEYDDRFAADKIIGEPNVYPKYGDYPGAWAQKTLSAKEFIVVEFDEQLYLTGVDIYETYNAGAVIGISAFDEVSGLWINLWKTAQATRIETSRIFSPAIQEQAIKSRRIRVDVDCTVANSWCEIDAIKIKGKQKSSNKPEVNEVPENLKELVNNPLFSDVAFLVEEKEVVAHKVILAARSGYFRSLLTDGTFGDDKRIKLANFSQNGLLALLHYIYSNEFDDSLPTQVLTELIRVGDRMSMLGMKTLSFQYLSHNINPDNAIDIYRNATEAAPRLTEIESLALDFISKHLTKITKTKAFSDLSKEVMFTVVQEAASRLNLD